MTYVLSAKTIDQSIFTDEIIKDNSSASSKQSGQNNISRDNLNGLREVADQFESIFLETLLSSARKSKLADGLFDSKADDNFEQMFDQEIAKTSSKTVDLGIAEAIIRQMSKVGNSSE
tara:strand:- start:281 stop:634 length:354 start_codon:yes stop_codon:yes gene_type:complete